MKNPLNKLKFILKSFSQNKSKSFHEILRQSNIEKKWWMGEYIFMDEKSSLFIDLTDRNPS